MATASKVQLNVTDCGEFHVPGITNESAAKASELLQENHEQHHVFYNAEGFHNHLAHHVLTLYALGASPAIIQRQYNDNKSYQRPPEPVDERVLEDLRDPRKFQQYLGKEKYYHDFLVHFQQAIDDKGYQAVINESLFQRDERADDLLVRMYAGFLHPLIHLGFGVEFKQPAIIAEALAQGAVHDKWIGRYLLEAERAASTTSDVEPLVDLLDKIRVDTKLSTAAQWGDGNKIRDGIMVRAPQEMIKYGSRWKVETSELEKKTAEMVNAAVYYTGGAQHPPKKVKFDFYYMHCVNCSIFFSAFLTQPWISPENKVRLLEWKGRLDICMYASRRSPKPLMDDVIGYKPQKPVTNAQNPWAELIARICVFDDDGHAAKLVRALAQGERVSEPFGDDRNFRVKDDMWLQLGNMAVDSVELKAATEPNWVRSAGFDEAWERIHDRPRAQL